MRVILACLGAALFLIIGPARLSAADRVSPNVLFIAVDDLRCDLNCYGVKYVHSPHIDRFASSAVTFTRAYVQVAVCNPSRVSVMTGLRPDTTKVWDLATEFRTTAPNAVTIPQHFRAHGYYAVSFGKVFHNPWPDNVSWSEPHRWPEGAELWSREAKQRLSAFREKMRADGRPQAAIDRVRAAATEIIDIPDNRHIDGAIADQAIEAMARLVKRDEPFFLAVGFMRPHLPFVVPRKYWELYDRNALPLASNPYFPKDMPGVAFGDRSRGGLYELTDYMDYVDAPSPFDAPLSEAQQRALRHGYYASVSFTDAQVGRVLDELDRLKLTDSTVVVLWSDHGWKLGEHNGWCKQTNFEVDTRAPLIIRQPHAALNGKPCDAIVEFVDIYPTLCELAGLPIPAALEGKSLAPLLRGAPAPKDSVAFSQFERVHEKKQYMGYAMRTDRYRYVEWLDRSTCAVAFRELYDHRSDPDENVNIAVAPENAPLLESLSAHMWKALPRPLP
ncbi:MAG: sulfatase-like hydrolase/transferase [Phycisphaera sp.]|nr:sulfatase-like hydrolase/transferase [Phycisphaera sp.]